MRITPSFNSPGPRAIALLTSLLTVTNLLHAQDALRTAIADDQAYQARNAPEFIPEAKRLHAGPVDFQLGATYELEWNDNVSLRPSNGDDDFIHRPALNLLASWAATANTHLSFGAGLGYEIYMNHPGLGGFTVTPNSAFAWDIKVKDFVFSLSDGFSYSRDVADQATIGSGIAEYPRVENTAGVRVRWTPSRYVLDAGYSHYNFFSQSGGSTNFDYLDRSAEQFIGRAGIRLAEATTLGVEASASLTDYQSDVQRDNTSVSLGPFVEWQVTEALQLSLRGGANLNSFDPNPTHPQSENLSTFYFGFRAQHRLTDFIRHGVSVLRDVQQGLNPGSDYVQQLSAGYFLNWNFHRSASVGADFSYSKSDEPQGGAANTYNVFGAGLSLTFQPISHVQTSLGYHFATRDSQLANSGYTQNTVTLDLTYQF